MALKQGMVLPPLSIYIHFPWCIRKCPYCDFNSYEMKGDGLDERAYLDALARDLEMSLPEISSLRPVQSVFIGGGTPSLITGEGVRHLMRLLGGAVTLAPDCEISLEANPGASDASRFAEYRAAGINRISIGVQSFSDAALRSLGRVHDGNDASTAIRYARQAGFTNINLDIIYALPGQTVIDAVEDLRVATDFRPEHISWYQLGIEPGTLFYKRPPILPDDDSSWEIQQAGQELLSAAGYQNYEISAWAAAENLRCVHNLNYWHFGDYLGIGAGAHSKLSDPGSGRINRLVRQPSPRKYMRLSGSKQVLSGNTFPQRGELHLEFMMNAMRLRDGFPTALFAERTGQSLADIRDRLDHAEGLGLIERWGEHIRPTSRGQRFLNNLLQLFI